MARLLEELKSAGAELELSGFEMEEIGELIAALPNNIKVDDPVVEDDFSRPGRFDIGKFIVKSKMRSES